MAGGRRTPRGGVPGHRRGARQSSFAKDEALALYDEAIALADDPAVGARFRLDRALSLIELADFEAGAAELDELTPGLDGPAI